MCSSTLLFKQMNSKYLLLSTRAIGHGLSKDNYFLSVRKVPSLKMGPRTALCKLFGRRSMATKPLQGHCAQGKGKIRGFGPLPGVRSVPNRPANIAAAVPEVPQGWYPSPVHSESEGMPCIIVYRRSSAHDLPHWRSEVFASTKNTHKKCRFFIFRHNRHFLVCRSF